jgi:hypothetical protein
MQSRLVYHIASDRRDTDRDGWIQLNYEDFMKVTNNIATSINGTPFNSIGCSQMVLSAP